MEIDHVRARGAVVDRHRQSRLPRARPTSTARSSAGTCPEGPPETRWLPGGRWWATAPSPASASRQHPGPPVWATYIAVENADEAAAKVLAAGGQVIVPAMDVLDVGRMAVFTDPVGARVLGVAGRHPPRRPVGQRAGHVVLERAPHHRRRGVEGRSTATVFGWTAQTHGAGPMGEYTEWQVSGRSVGGMMQKPPMMPAEVPPFWAVYFAVADTDAAVARVTELGGTVMMPPMDIEPGRFATVADPSGGAFSVIALVARAARRRLTPVSQHAPGGG